MLSRWICVAAVVTLGAWAWSPDRAHPGPAADPPGTPPKGPLSAREEMATFKVPNGFMVELVACEPDVVDPVAMAFDENGRLFVAEMPGYPNGGVGTGKITTGRIKMLQDVDGDGFYEKSTLFLADLRFPTAVMPYKGGVLIANAPELIFAEDSDGAGKADKKRVLYTGFDIANIQQLLSGLQWGLDNWVHGCAGGKGGTITSAEKPNAPAVELRSRGIRFRPDRPASLEPTSGGGQYGLTCDQWGQWFTATNSQHLRHIILPDHYLKRNPFLPVSAVTLDIPDHGAACKVYRISPFEQWRVERTKQRKDGPNASKFPPTELFPGGYVTSACSPMVYEATLFPTAYHGNSFVCDPANNLVHRDVLQRHGATFQAKRVDIECEFMASTDTWFRPVWLTLGPDGAIYVLDFYREVIETPLSLPDDIKAKLNLESRGKGRIWRIVPEGKRALVRPALGKATTIELVRHLDNPNYWWRITAQRLLVERQDKGAVPLLVQLAKNAKLPAGRMHALRALQGLGIVDDNLIDNALHDDSAGVRQHALQLVESRLQASAKLRKAVLALADDPAPEVRFQLAFTLGECDAPEAVAALAKIAVRDAGDKWTQTAVLSSASKTAPTLLTALTRDKAFATSGKASHLQMLTRVAALVAGRLSDDDLAQGLTLLASKNGAFADWQVAVLEGLGQGLQMRQKSLAKLWDNPPPALKTAIEQTRPLFEQAVKTAADQTQPLDQRQAALRLLGYGPFALALPVACDHLAPQAPPELQVAAVRCLGQHDQPQVAETLLTAWKGAGPSLRREILDALFARTDRVRQLLDALERKQVLASQLEPAKLTLLRKHPDAKVRARAEKLLKDQIVPARQEVIDRYEKATLAEKPSAVRGKALFKKVCAACHRLENEGIEVGPDLNSALANKTPEALLIDILDPSREVDPRYIEYVITTTDGRQLTGMIAAETASSVTLRRAEKAEDTLLRSQIDSIQATAKSLMPEGLEMQLPPQDVYDVIAYLRSVAAKK
jgi:putative membrane-bound dehydrogenase-like protein